MKSFIIELAGFVSDLSKVEKLTERDRLIISHSFEIGFRKGIEAAIELKETK